MYVLPAATGKGSFLENLKHQYNVGIPSALGVRPRPAFDLSRIPEAERQTVNSHQSKTWWHLAGVAA
ncbi:MAG: hypothetical protein AABX78_03745 [Nanoarchaeota archaeon]